MILITGHKGFIGTNLRNMTGWSGIDLPETDIRHPEQLAAALEGYDTVIHLAALPGVKGSIEREQEYVETNITGTYNIARACYERNIRLIFASSSSVYDLKSPYARTKQGGEDIIGAFRRHGLNACILRFFTVFGEYNRKDMAVYKFIRAIHLGHPIELYGDCYRDFTYVQDLCKALRKLTEHDDIQGVFDLGFGNPVRVHDLVTVIEQVTGQRTVIRPKEARPYDARITRADPWLMHKLNIPMTGLEQAMRNTVYNILHDENL